MSPQVSFEQASPALDEVQLSKVSPEARSTEGQVKWGPALGFIGGVGLTAGVAASGLGWVSAVPAFVLGGAVGLFLTHEAVDKMISNGRDSSGTGPISAFASVLGGIGSAVGAASLALSHGSPMVGLGLGVAVSALAAAGGAYVHHSSRNGSAG